MDTSPEEDDLNLTGTILTSTPVVPASTPPTPPESAAHGHRSLAHRVARRISASRTRGETPKTQSPKNGSPKEGDGEEGVDIFESRRASLKGKAAAVVKTKLGSAMKKVGRRKSIGGTEDEEEKEKISRASSAITPHRTKVFFDITVGGEPAGRVAFRLFDDVCPLTCENFRLLTTGESGPGRTGKNRHYRGTRIFRVIPHFLVQGGDVTNDDGSGGECALSTGGKFFDDENFYLKHDRCGVLGMASDGPHRNASQFYLTTAPCHWLDGRFVVFGDIIKGHLTIAQLEKHGHPSGRVSVDIRIFDCGQLPDGWTGVDLTVEERDAYAVAARIEKPLLEPTLGTDKMKAMGRRLD